MDWNELKVRLHAIEHQQKQTNELLCQLVRRVAIGCPACKEVNLIPGHEIHQDTTCRHCNERLLP